MARMNQYPGAPLDKALTLANAVDSMGGSCSQESAADAIGMKMGGGYKVLMGAGSRYGITESSRGRLAVTPLYRRFKLAYDETEARAIRKEMMLNVPMFQDIVKRFASARLPSHFDKLLVREYDVPEELASRIVQYFTSAAKSSGAMDESGMILATATESNPSEVPRDDVGESSAVTQADVELKETTNAAYRIRVTGPGIDSSIVLNDLDDLAMLEPMLAKIRKKLAADADTE